MENSIVADGSRRLLKGQKELTMKSIEKRYTTEIAAAKPHQKEKIYQRMADELSRQKNHKPSAAALW